LRRFCQRGLVFEEGRIAFDGPLKKALAYYHRNGVSGDVDPLPQDASV
jgi:lipopolysaccharide transport system ATP-binding protein